MNKKMKKFMFLVMGVFMLFIATGCSNDKVDNAKEKVSSWATSTWDDVTQTWDDATTFVENVITENIEVEKVEVETITVKPLNNLEIKITK